jgi:hypothetical protein
LYIWGWLCHGDTCVDGDRKVEMLEPSTRRRHADTDIYILTEVSLAGLMMIIEDNCSVKCVVLL